MAVKYKDFFVRVVVGFVVLVAIASYVASVVAGTQVPH